MPESLLPRCPQCNARMLPAEHGTGLWCQFCGVVLDDPDARKTAEQAQAQRATQDGYDPPSRDWDMPLEDRRLLDSAWRSIQQGDTVSAAYLLREGVSRDADLADAWYLLSLTTDDPGEKTIYLDRALEIQPYHEYAWRDKGVLEGVIPDQPATATTPDPASEPQPDTVEAESETQACPLCGGMVAYDVALGVLVCRHCGYRAGAAPAAHPAAAPRGYQKLDDALLQRRFGFTREWHIGARVLVCQNCHAQLTLSSTTLSTQCPFCDSAHVLVQDAVGSFEEPDALLPFKIDRAAAAQAVHRQLEAAIRPQIERGEMQAVYLPFWAFKALVSIRSTLGLMPDAPSQGRYQGPTAMTFSIPLFSVTLGDERPANASRATGEPFRSGVYGVDDALVGGGTEPRQAVLYELMPYDLGGLVAYDPRYLAQRSAQIYSVDVIQASITARAYAKYVARRLATGYPAPAMDLARTDSRAYNPPDSPLWRAVQVTIETLHYRLILLPVWMISLILRSGMHRPAVVNGQTGEAILSSSFETPDTILNPRRAGVEDMPPSPSRRHSSVIRPIDPPPARARVIRPLKRR